MKKAIMVTIVLLALAMTIVWLMNRGPEPSVLVLRNTGTNSVFVRTWPSLPLPRLAFTLRARPFIARPVPLNAVILNHGCIVTQKFAPGARIEICTRMPSGPLEAIERPDGVILTDGFAPATTNLQFQTVWHRTVQRLEAEVNGDAATNELFRVIKVAEK
jgi:hypothetical protein